MVNQQHIPEEQVSRYMAEMKSFIVASLPPNENASPWISSIPGPKSASGNGGPNVSKKSNCKRNALSCWTKK